MVTVEYTAKGEAVSDFEWEYWASQVKADIAAGKDSVFYVATSLAIEGLRLEIARGRIDPDDVVFRYDGEDIRSDATGMLDCWPLGFCDVTTHILHEIISIRLSEPGSEAAS